MTNHDETARIDAVCDDYERALKLGKRIELRGALRQVSEKARADLLRELLALERDIRDAADWPDRIEELERELPEFTKVITEFAPDADHTLQPDEEDTASDLRTGKPKQIGPYRVLQLIGEGGMGSVYMAQQEKPVRRRVALKIIRQGLDSKQVIARFEAERQALAMMDHRSIARILDAGTTESRQPFFAMELVKGTPLTDYCDQHKLDVNERLEIFGHICDAVQHAHQKGIIHRDLKPTNILVAEERGKPLPKIIDFGLAKALETSTKLTDKTMFTEFGQVIGTVKYMSPEQAGLDALDVDTRSDIYTLGVILYELLTGFTPLDSDAIQDRAILQVLEMVRNNEARRPSSRLSGNSDKISQILERRQIESRQLTQMLSGDLDWIVMKALEKDRNRRYESAAELANDLDRYRNNDPVSARPPSKGYVLAKLFRKHRALVGSLATVGVVLIIATIVCSILAINLDQKAREAIAARTTAFDAEMAAVDAQRIAEKERDAAKRSLERAESERRKAERQKAIATTVLNFMQSNLLGQADIYQQANDGSNSFVKKQLTVIEALRKAGREFSPEKIEKKFPQQPAIQANILETMAEIFSAIEEHPTAIAFSDAALRIRKEMSPDYPAGHQLVGMTQRVIILLNATRHVEAAETFATVLNDLHTIMRWDEASRPAALDVHDLDAHIDAEVDLVINAVAERLTPKRLQLPQLDIADLKGAEPFRVGAAIVSAISNIGSIHKLMLDRYGRDDHRTIYAYMMVGLVSHFRGAVQDKINFPGLGGAAALDDAIATYETVIEYCERKLPPDDLRVVGVRLVLAVALEKKNGRLDRTALRCYELAARSCRQELPADHPATILVEMHLGRRLMRHRRYDEAEPVLARTATNHRKVYGTKDEHTPFLFLDWGRASWEVTRRLAFDDGTREAKLDQTITTLAEAARLMLQHYGVDDADSAEAAHELAQAYLERGKPENALKHFRSAWVYRSKHVQEKGNDEPLSGIALCLEATGSSKEAVEQLQALLDLRSKQLSDHPLIAATKWRLARAAEESGNKELSQELRDQLGVKEGASLRIEVTDQTKFARRIGREFRMLDWPIVDLKVDDTGPKPTFSVTYEASPKKTLQHLWAKSSPQSYAAFEKKQTDNGFRLVKKIEYTNAGRPRIASLWHRQSEN